MLPQVTLESPDAAVDGWVRERLGAFNHAATNRPERQRFHVVLRAANGGLKGGLIASIGFDVLRIDELFLEEPYRRGGYGSRLMRLAEDEGLRRGARLSCVMTFSFQARPFYEKLGYQLFAELPYQNGAHTLFWLKKSLCA